MTEKYFHKKIIEVPLYKGKLVIVITNDSDKLNKIVSDHDVDSEIYAHSFYGGLNGHQAFVMALNFNHSFSKITHGTITHEAIHIAHYIADYRGFIADFENDEPITYLAGWIANEVYKFIDKHNFKPSLNK